MSPKARFAVVALFALYVGLATVTDWAYGPVAMFASIMVFLGPLLIGFVYCLPDEKAEHHHTPVDMIPSGA